MPSDPRPATAKAARQAARAAALRYVSDETPGIGRRRHGARFRYTQPGGGRLADRAALRRIKALAIPPAWTEVWICPFENGHIQATGRDERGRKQYRYHPRWRETRDAAKFGRMADFARLLPRIRERVAADLRRTGLPREKVLATVVRLLETTLIRVGNDDYARQNGSYGLTTLRTRHVAVEGSSLRFLFKGKSGKTWRLQLQDRRLARILRECQELPGQELFQYLDADGQRCGIDSGDVNDYLRDIAGAEVTAKDFRTWAGTVLAALALHEFERVDSAAAAKRNVKQAIEQVAARLGNTPTICRKCYVHPGLLDLYMDGELALRLKQEAEEKLREEAAGLRPEETAVLGLLIGKLARATRSSPRIVRAGAESRAATA
ncbi:DNA topoisomerase IB [Roseicella frigidaeris]|uniref:DNA topoisomerase IB n=1 Tax=Roseicella frigidaeris TaxID=2230885 RepID=A0A327LTT1_9PROT|nr:DNA topoisomerase IB [Roseicella frigidaeris]RAI54131.1 DNA topoisomerase IB [Roseicella frigidaeris]